ncbi:MAG: AAA family ATPase [Caldilinea sp.]
MPTVDPLTIELRSKLRSGTSIIWAMLVGDEQQAYEIISEALVDKDDLTLAEVAYNWDPQFGASWLGRGDAQMESKDPIFALNSLLEETKRCVVFMRDLGLILADPRFVGLRRHLLTFCQQELLTNAENLRTLVVLAYEPPPAILREYCDIVELRVPNYEEMEAKVFNRIHDGLRETLRVQGHSLELANCSQTLKENIINRLLGLSTIEAQRVLSYAVNRHGFRPEIIDTLIEEKIKIIKSIEGLTYVPNSEIPDLADFGAIDDFVAQLDIDSALFSKEAQQLGLEAPLGCVLLGPAGTGKSKMGMAAAKKLNLDLVKLDISDMYNKYVGETEARMRQALGVIKGMPRCLLLIDEIDKVMKDAHKSSGDSGISGRLLNKLLTELAGRHHSTKDSCMYVLVTMNRYNTVAEELLRAGRFDIMWSTGMPDAEDRLEILQIHLRKRGVDISTYGASLQNVVNATANYTGAELEHAVRLALRTKFHRLWSDPTNRPITKDQLRPSVNELLEAVAQVHQVAKINPTALAELKEFCEGNTRPVKGHAKAKNERKARRVSHPTLKSNPENN